MCDASSMERGCGHVFKKKLLYWIITYDIFYPCSLEIKKKKKKNNDGTHINKSIMS